MQPGDRWFAALQYVLPKHALSRVIYAVARSESRWIRTTFLRIFLSGYTLTEDKSGKKSNALHEYEL